MSDVLVLGAGMVGVATALALQARGHHVALIDRRGPGEEASYGNAGLIQAEAVEPYGLPLDFTTLSRIALRRSNAVAYSFAGLKAQGRALLSYALASRQGPYQRNVVPHWAPLALASTADHAPLIAASEAEGIIRRDGFRVAYRTPKALDMVFAEADRLKNDFGVPSIAMDGNALASAEPGMKQRLAGAIHWTSAWSCTDPGGLVRAYAELFARRGGLFAFADAQTLRREGQAWVVGSGAQKLQAEAAVICLGPWSGVLLRQFGLRVPMVLKRGYHRHFSAPMGPKLPIMDAENATFLSPMRQGLRVLTGADLAPLDAPQNLRQIEVSTKAAQSLFDLGAPVEDKVWSGVRPCMPDMLPRTGKVPGHPGLWQNFGHGHQGFTLGPTSARLLAEAFDKSGS
jgi:D-amino-acid dehydrogenase